MLIPSKHALALALAPFLLAVGCKQSPPPEQPAQSQPAAAPTQIGGQDIVKLERKPTSNGQKPEFLTATVFPGRGMNLFQITANIPGKGTVDVFASPSIEEAGKILTLGSEDMN